MSSVPPTLPIATAALLAGTSDRPFRRNILKPKLVKLDRDGKVITASLAAYLGSEITEQAYLAADRRRDAARQWQRNYRRQHREAGHAAA